MYTSPIGATSISDCKGCAPAKYSDGSHAGTSQACKNCPVGRHGGTILNTYSLAVRCPRCEEGRYNDQVGKTACKECQKGFFTTAIGQQEAANCVSCEPGRYNDAVGLVNSVTHFKCHSCPKGFYQSVGKGVEEYFAYFKTDTQDGIGSDCTKFAIDTVMVLNLQACKIKCGQHILCQGISYNSAANTCVRRKFACETKIETVPTSTYYGRHLLWSCKSCPAAKYSDQVLSNTCKDCPAGYYLESIGSVTWNACNPCEKGKYGDQSYVLSYGCKMCSGGKYNNKTAAAECIGVCAAGQFAPQSSSRFGHDDSTDCKLCPKGFFQPGAGDVRCMGCNGVMEEGLTKCDGCAPGKRKNTDASDGCSSCGIGMYTDAVNLEECKDCPTGYFTEEEKTDQATGCQACSAGFYSMVTKQTDEATACKACSKGKYSTLLASNDISKCKSCDPGRYNEDTGKPDPSACTPCSPGTWSNAVAAVSLDSCVSCLHGKYSASVAAPSENRCSECPTGWYQNAIGQTSCLLCVPGTSQSKRGRNSCNDCEMGSYTGSSGLDGTFFMILFLKVIFLIFF